MTFLARLLRRPAAAAPVPVATPVAPRPSGSRMRRNSALAAACVTCVAGFEGLRLNAYPDPATGREPWTACYGETEGVTRGERFTLAQCKAMLAASLESFATGMEGCITRPLPDTTYSAFLSLSYNVGTGAFCKSSVARLWNAGEGRSSCDAMLKWNRAAGVVMTGLTRRREQERALCLQGLAQ